MARHHTLYIAGKLAATNDVVLLTLHTALPATVDNRISLGYARDTRAAAEIVYNWQFEDYASTMVWDTVGMDAADTEFVCDTVDRWMLSQLKPVSLFQ